MALHIVNEPSFGGRLGTAIGTGISGLLDNLVQQKVQDMQQKKNAQGYQQGWNLSPEQAQFVASQSPEFQQDFIKALQSQQQSEAFQRAINPEQNVQQPSLQNMGAMLQPQQQPSLEESMNSMGKNSPQDAIAMNLEKLVPQLLRQSQQAQPAAVLPPSVTQNGPAGNASAQAAPQQPNPQARSVADVLANRPLSPQLLAKAEELKERKRGNAYKEQILAYRQVGKQLEKLHDKAERGRRDKAELLRAKKYNDSGQLVQGKQRQILEALGLQDFFTNNPTQVVDKIIARMESGVSDAYGTGRPTNFLADNYKRQLPRLINTKEGFNAISENLIDEIDAHEIVDRKAREIETAYNKAKIPLPLDIIAQAREEARPQLDALEERSMKRLDDAVTKIDKKGSRTEYSGLPKAADYKSTKPLVDTEKKLTGTVVNGQWKWRRATPDEIKRAEG